MMHYYIYSGTALIEQLIETFDILLQDRNQLIPFIKESLSIKKQVIEVDDFDTGEKRKFNYGHTFWSCFGVLNELRDKSWTSSHSRMSLANYIGLN
jgi:3-dehydroquinate synthase